MKIVLAGATGFLGRPLTRALAADGHELVGLTRRPRADADLRQVAWKPDGTAGPWAAEIDGADVVVNLAGESIADGRWTAERKRALRDSRLRSTGSLVAAIDRAPRRPSLLLSSSAVGYYGPRGDEIVDEALQLGARWEGGIQLLRLAGMAGQEEPDGFSILLLRDAREEEEASRIQRVLHREENLAVPFVEGGRVRAVADVTLENLLRPPSTSACDFRID